MTNAQCPMPMPNANANANAQCTMHNAQWTCSRLYLLWLCLLWQVRGVDLLSLSLDEVRNTQCPMTIAHDCP